MVSGLFCRLERKKGRGYQLQALNADTKGFMVTGVVVVVVVVVATDG